MAYWLTSQNRKRHQRAINSMVRKINKSIEQDNLWQGRFYIRQVAAQWRVYEDKSGCDLWVVLEFRDKITGATRSVVDVVNHLTFGNGFKLWKRMNDFIINDVQVWSEPEMRERFNR